MTNELKLFFDNFDKLAESPGGVQKLRELILQLAVQGELVPQNPKDEPASELLKKIKAEKEKLIKEGKIKIQKPLAAIKTNEVPIKLPLNWAFVRIGSISNIVYGKNLPVKDLTNDGYPVWGANGIIGCYSKYLYEKSQLLISCRGAYSGKINMSPPNAFITNNSLVLEMTPIAKTSMHYLFYCLTALDKAKLVSGSAQPQVTTKNASPLIIPLPPLAEQKRIVARVDELMASCDELEQKQQKAAHRRVVLNNSAIDHLLAAEKPKEFNKHWQLICDNFDLLYDNLKNVNKLRQAILQLAVQGKLVSQDPKDEPASELLKKIKAKKEKLIKEGKIRKQKPLTPIEADEIPYKLPKVWQWSRLQDCYDVRDGTHDTPKYLSKGIPLITSKDFKKGDIDFANAKIISESDHNIIKKRSLVEKQDILFSMIGGNIGNMVMVNTSKEFSIKNVALFKYYDKNFSLPQYLMCFLKYISNLIQSNAFGGAQPFVSLSYLRNHPFPLPPLSEQKRIVKKIDELMALCDQVEEKMKQSQDKSEKLMAATIHHLLVA